MMFKFFFLLVLVLMLLLFVVVEDVLFCLVFSVDGSELVDIVVGLVWLCCVEGMYWDGWCCVGELCLVIYVGVLFLVCMCGEVEGRVWWVLCVVEMKCLLECFVYVGDVVVLVLLVFVGWYWMSIICIESEGVNFYNY